MHVKHLNKLVLKDGIRHHVLCCPMFRPVSIYPDPIRGGDNVLVMCQVMDPLGKAHPTNTRAQLEALITPDVKA